MNKIVQERSEILFKMGLKYDGQTFYCKDCPISLNFHYSDLLSIDNQKFNEVLQYHSNNHKMETAQENKLAIMDQIPTIAQTLPEVLNLNKASTDKAVAYGLTMYKEIEE